MQSNSPFSTAKMQKADPLRMHQRATKDANDPVWADTMSYCFNEEMYTGIGVNDVTTPVYWGIRIDASLLAGRNNLTDVRLFVASAGTYTLNVSFGADVPGAALYTQTVTATTDDEMTWMTFHLTTPLALDATQNLWVVFVNSDVNYPATAVIGNQYDDGKWLSLDNTEWNLSSDYELDYTWMIQAVSDTYIPLPPTVDLSGDVSIVLGEEATFTAYSAMAETFEWTVDGEIVEEEGNTLTYTFTAAGNHTIGVTASNDLGSAEDSLDVVVYDCSEAISEFPYVENFEQYNPCWSVEVADDANNDRIGIMEYNQAFQGSRVFVMSSYSEAEDYNQFLISPEIELPEEGNYALHFWYRGYNAGDAFRVKVSTTTADTAAFTTVLADYPTVPTVWTEFVGILPAGTKHVAINYYGDYMYYLFIDSLTIDEVFLPGVHIAGPAAMGSGNEAVYTATHSFAESIAWYIDDVEQVGETGDTLVTVFATGGNHTVKVAAANANGIVYDSIVVDVLDCNNISFPYAPDFSATLGCWISRSDSTEDMGWFLSSEVMDEPVGQVVSMSAESVLGIFMMDVPVDNWLTSPIFTMPTEGAYEVAWKVSPVDPNYSGDHYGLYIIYPDGQSELLFEESLTGLTDFADRVAAIPATVSGDFRIAFRHFNNVGGYALVLDEIQVRALSPAIVTLQGPTEAELDYEVSFTAVSANADSFEWTVDGTAVTAEGNVLNYTFHAAGEHTVAVTATNMAGSNTATLTVNVFSCDAITEFPYIQDFETAGTFGCWHFVDADGDGYGWDTDFLRDEEEACGHNGSQGLASSASYINGLGALTPDNWMIMPAVSLPAAGTYYLSWYAKGLDASYSAENYSVYVSTTGNTVADFTTAYFTEATTNEWFGHNVNLGDFSGQTIYIAFRHHGCTDMYNLLIDDIMISTETVGIDPAAAASVAVYPNPVVDKLNVEGEGISEVRVIDLNGRTVATAAAAGVVDVESLSAGMYIVRVVAADGVHTSKIVKN